MTGAMDDMKKYELSDMDKMGINKTVKTLIFYEVPSTVDSDKLISSMMEGVKNATRQLPFMAGSLQFDDSGKLCIMTPPESQIEVNIHRFESTEHKCFSALAKGSFSPNELDFTQFLPQEPGPKDSVCAMQLSLVEGGLVLGFRMAHAAGDWSSIDTFLSLVCQGSKAHQEGLEMPTYTPDLNRKPYNTPAPDPTISRQGLLERLPMFYIMKKSQLKPKLPPPSQSRIFKTSEQAIQQLKAQSTPYLSGVDYITSYDCISALLWTSITRARLHIHPEKTASPSRFVHPIDVRTRDPENRTSERYFGNAVIGCQAGPIPAQALVSDGDRGLATAAALIRQSINTVNLSSISHMTSLIASLSPEETLGLHPDFTDMDMFMNTWYSGSAEKYDIGAGSIPVAFRLHSSMAGGSVVILPNFSREETRVFDVVVQLADEEQELLGKDAEFLKYFEIIA